MDLFNPYRTDREVNVEALKNIPGLGIVYDFVSPSVESELINSIDKSEWLNDLNRKVQHYGFKYDYRSRKIDETFRLGPLPDWAEKVNDKLLEDEIISFRPNQVIVNNYEPGQGIADHVDCEPCFGDTILSLSLNSNIVMVFKSLNRPKKYEVLLPARSLVCLTGDARYKFTHGIPSRKADVFNNQKRPRSRRISLTFRKVVLN